MTKLRVLLLLAVGAFLISGIPAALAAPKYQIVQPSGDTLSIEKKADGRMEVTNPAGDVIGYLQRKSEKDKGFDVYDAGGRLLGTVGHVNPEGLELLTQKRAES